jgi:putative membrane protein
VTEHTHGGDHTEHADGAGPAGEGIAAGAKPARAPGAGAPGAAAADEEGTEPDARFTFANERTFLAWSRTSLALVVGGLAITQLLPPFPGVPWGRHALGTPLILLGCAISVTSYLEWKANQRALRLGRPLNRSRLPQLLAVAIAVIALAAAVLALISGVRAR